MFIYTDCCFVDRQLFYLFFPFFPITNVKVFFHLDIHEDISKLILETVFQTIFVILLRFHGLF